MMKIIAIKTQEGYLISDNLKNESYFTSKLGNKLFDGVSPLPTFKSHWYKIKHKPSTIEQKVSHSALNCRWELKPEFQLGDLKKVWFHTEIYDSDGDIIEEFEQIKGLYEYKQDDQPDTLEPIEFEWDEILEIEVFTEPTGFSYKSTGQYPNSQTYPNITEKNLKYDILSEVLTPSILLHTQPCKLSSKETYNIIRKFVKDNINPKVAEITSDYDFCFCVEKKIPLAQPYTYQVDVNNSIFTKKKRKPKYQTRLVDKKHVKVFEMTHDQAGNNGKGYDKYTLVTPFEAENQEELKKYIDTYLDELITVINEPLCECDKCNGTGVLSTEMIK